MKFIAVIAFMTIIIIVSIAQKEQKALRDENALLKADIVAWQYEASSVVALRGWMGKYGGVEKANDITPQILGYALDRCYLTAAGNINHSDPNCLNRAVGQ